MIDLNDGLKYPDILKAHMSLMIQALKCGITNVATIQLSDSSGNNINFAFVPGIPPAGTGYKSQFRNFHDVGHNPVLNGVDHKRIVDRWMMQQLADFMTDMKAVPEEGGTLLDSSVILFGNHMQDGSNHDENKIPWIARRQGWRLLQHRPVRAQRGQAAQRRHDRHLLRPCGVPTRPSAPPGPD